MKYIFILLILSCSTVSAQDSATLEQLRAALGENPPQAALDRIFDGDYCSGMPAVDVAAEASRQAAPAAPAGIRPTRAYPVPPVPATFAESAAADKASNWDEFAFGERLTRDELAVVKGGLDLLKGTKSGDSLYCFILRRAWNCAGAKKKI